MFAFPHFRRSAFLLLVLSASAAPGQDQPRPVRHGLSQPGEEFLVLRHQILEKGRHEDFYRASRDAVWPLYEKIGARVVGQWQVVLSESEAREVDEGYRIARYRSFDHWLATRTPGELAGNGADLEAGLGAIRLRNLWLKGSKGVVYLAGSRASLGPYYFPPLEESYKLAERSSAVDGQESIHPVRSQRAKAGDEIVTLRYFRIKKGSFDDFNRLSVQGVWPFFEKMGARVFGQWRVVYPTEEQFKGRPTGVLRQESQDYDEAYMMVRYASLEHWQATRPDVMHLLGGDGQDYDAATEALARRRDLTLETSVEFLRGYFYSSPPIYLPSVDETFEFSDQPD